MAAALNIDDTTPNICIMPDLPEPKAIIIDVYNYLQDQEYDGGYGFNKKAKGDKNKKTSKYIIWHFICELYGDL